MVYRWLDDDLLVILHKHVDGHTDTFYDARYIGEPLALYLPLMVVINPSDGGGPQFLGHYGVAEE